MATKKKNNHYVTEKNLQKQQEKEALQQKKKHKEICKTVLWCVLAVVLLAGFIIGVGAIFGMFDYNPTSTEHANIAIEYNGQKYTLHVELYGEDAPKTVEAFKKIMDDKYYNGKLMYQLIDDRLYCGGQSSTGYQMIEGEFAANGFENKISHKRGYIAMAHGEDNNSADGRFFIMTENHPELDGSYAVFGCIIDNGMDTLDDIIEEMMKNGDIDENGLISNPPVIESISSHSH